MAQKLVKLKRKHLIIIMTNILLLKTENLTTEKFVEEISTSKTSLKSPYW